MGTFSRQVYPLCRSQWARAGHNGDNTGNLEPLMDGKLSAAVLEKAPLLMMEDLELTILMPCLNEAETIAGCIENARSFLGRTGILGEVLISDNGSTDGSIDIAHEHGARVVHAPTRGYGAALKYGIEQARGRYVIMADSDGSYDFGQLEEFVERLREGTDLVMGNRFAGGIKVGAMPILHKHLGNPVLSFLGRLFFDTRVGDTFCGLRGFNRQRILDLGLKSRGMEFAIEMVVRSSLAGFTIVEVPTTLAPDGRSRPPHLRTWRDGWRSLRFLLLYSPRWLFLYPGIALLGLGAVLSVLILPGPLTVLPNIILDIHTLMLACIAVLVGTQCISYAVLTRSYAATHGLLPPSHRLRRLLSSLTLERILLVSTFIFFAGMSGVMYSVYYWYTVHFGSIQYSFLIRVVVVSGTAIALSFQITFTAFLYAALELGAHPGSPDS
jgi:glycosyltransferase involved in cell wall biosynthesis